MAFDNLSYTGGVAQDYANATGISNVKFDETAFNQLKDVDFSKASVDKTCTSRDEFTDDHVLFQAKEWVSG